MAAPIFQRTVVDEQGNIIAGAVVEVRNELTDELAPIFVDRQLTDVKANPFTTDSTGFIRFFAAAGDYRIKATFGAEEIIFRFVQLIDTDELIDLDSEQTLENKTLIEPNIETISNAGLLTLPAATDTLVGRATTDTLTNKTLTSPTINGGTITGITDLAVADGGTGRSTLTANNVLIGDGTSAVNFVAPGDSGNVLTSNGTQWISEPVTAPGGVIVATQFEATGTGANIMPVGTTAQRPASPVEGMFRLNTTTTEPEWYDEESGEWVSFRVEPDRTITADFLVIAGGGGGGSADGNSNGGGGGAGGYREFTGQSLAVGTAFTVTVGAGGGIAGSGSNSVFSSTTSTGGGNGGTLGGAGANGGSGGGAGGNDAGSQSGGTGNTPSTSPSQGNNGGACVNQYTGGGGGGASAVGSASNVSSGAGGAGTASSITGSSVTRAGGGGGNSGAGGSGGGGAGGNPPTNGTDNTGGGGGGTNGPGNGSTGGSGVVIIKYPDTFTITNPGGGLTFTTASSGGFKVTTFTAGTGTIQFD